MAGEYQTPLSFSLKEAVWFKKGQEVADLLSIELNPQIGIEEKDNYVQVKGSLELYGEYNKKEAEVPFSLRDFGQEKTVEDITEREDGVSVFTHYFPIDITIPKARVKELEEIYVLVDSFDYELPENNALQIAADLTITGLYEEEKVAGIIETEAVVEASAELAESADDEEGTLLESESTEFEAAADTTIEDTFAAFAFEARKSPVEAEEEIEAYEAKGTEEEIEAYEAYEAKGTEEEIEAYEAKGTEEEIEVYEAKGTEEEVETYEAKRAEEEVEAYEVKGQEEVAEVKEYEVEGQEKEKEYPKIKIFSLQEEVEHQHLSAAEEPKAVERFEIEALSRQTAKFEDEVSLDNSAVESQEEIKSQKEEQVTPRPENELYLTRIFGHGEEKFRKVRMYIVQNGDTLESIAEKYDIQVQQITRRNQLEEFYVTEGQILYLPAKKSNS